MDTQMQSPVSDSSVWLSEPWDKLLRAHTERTVRRGPDECWEWTGFVNKVSGYGQFGLGYQGGRLSWYAHRFAWLAAHGPITEGWAIDHLCLNKLCQNPAHMEPVTHGENGRRAALEFYKATNTAERCVHGHVGEMVERKDRRGRHRCWRCKRCSREKLAAKRAKLKAETGLTYRPKPRAM